MENKENTLTSLSERVGATISYTLPLLEIFITFNTILFELLGNIFESILSFIEVYLTIPNLGSYLFFLEGSSIIIPNGGFYISLILYLLFVRQNISATRFIRYNIMQSLIFYILITLLARVLHSVPSPLKKSLYGKIMTNGAILTVIDKEVSVFSLFSIIIPDSDLLYKFLT
nr:Tic20 family Ycf60 [Cavernulicola chilensis]